MKRSLSAAVIILLLGFLLKYPREALAASRDGLNLWLNTLLPTLLPFMILTGILIHTETAEKITAPAKLLWKKIFGLSPSGAYALILGLLCGYPMGAKITSDMYRHGKIGKREAQYLLTFTNHASPVFIHTYLIHICLEDRADKRILTMILLLSAVFTMLFFRFVIYRNHTMEKKQPSGLKKEPSAARPSGTVLDTSIMNGFETITRLGGYILLFSVLSACVRHYWQPGSAAGYLLLGSLELTTGLHLLAGSALDFEIKYLTAAVLTSFGGFCIMAQTKSVLSEELSVLPYLAAKCLNALFTALLILIFVKIV